MQYTRQCLSNDIEALKYKLSILDKTILSSDQERKKIEQQLQALAAQKDRLEKLIVDILNGEGYSKLKQIVKENEAALSENKQVISVSFTALLQMLKSDPKMINTIYKILAANDGEQHKENNDNAIKYLQANKDNILGLAKKYCENIIDALTNNAIATITADSSFNPTLSLPELSSTFSNLFDQNDIYSIEEPIHIMLNDIITVE